MSEHKLTVEFDRDVKYDMGATFDGDDSFNLYFINMKGSFYLTMENSYDNIYFKDEPCNFSDGDMKAKISITDLIETIANGEYRQTNGKATSDWISRLVGDYTNKDIILFNGKSYADSSYFWTEFFKEMPKDEIKDFVKFCKSYITLPNIEVDTVSQKWVIEDDIVSLDYNRQYSITINDDLTVEQVESFNCDSIDATQLMELNSYDEDDEYYESRKSYKKSLKEGINDELLGKSSDGEYALYLSNCRDANHGKDPHFEIFLVENGYVTRSIRTDNSNCEKVVMQWVKQYGIEVSKTLIKTSINMKESKKRVRESKAITHESNIEYVIDTLKQNKLRYCDISYDFSDEDCYIDIKQENKSTGNVSVWSFDIDFGANKVYMLEPRSKFLDDFEDDYEILTIIKRNM